MGPACHWCARLPEPFPQPRESAPQRLFLGVLHRIFGNLPDRWGFCRRSFGGRCVFGRLGSRLIIGRLDCVVGIRLIRGLFVVNLFVVSLLRFGVFSFSYVGGGRLRRLSLSGVLRRSFRLGLDLFGFSLSGFIFRFGNVRDVTLNLGGFLGFGVCRLL